MTAQHLRFSNLATRLITKNGRKVNLLSIENSGEKWDPSQEIIRIEVIAVQTRYKKKEVDGSKIREDDICFIVDSEIEPIETMRIEDGEIDYAIVDISVIKPGNTTCLYKIQARI